MTSTHLKSIFITLALLAGNLCSAQDNPILADWEGLPIIITIYKEGNKVFLGDGQEKYDVTIKKNKVTVDMNGRKYTGVYDENSDLLYLYGVYLKRFTR